MKNQDDLSTFGEAWRSETPARPAPDLTRRQRAQRAHLIIESTIATLGAVVGLVLVVQGPAVIGLTALVYSLFGAWMAWRTRSRNIDALSKSTRDYFTVQYAVLKVQRNHFGSGAAMCTAALVFFGVVRWQQTVALSALDAVITIGLLLGVAFFLARSGAMQRSLGRLDAQMRSMGRD